jgi:hypothetical protein
MKEIQEVMALLEYFHCVMAELPKHVYAVAYGQIVTYCECVSIVDFCAD